MILSSRQLFLKLEEWLKFKITSSHKFVWIDVLEIQEIKFKNDLFDLYQKDQSFILECICKKNNIPYEIYKANPWISDQDRLVEFSKFLLWKSSNYNTILISKISKEQEHFGEYKKYSFDKMDIYPFINLTQSNINAIVKSIELQDELISYPVASKLEWLYEQDKKFNIISSMNNPTTHPMWGSYSLEQKSLIAKYFALIKERDHKINRKDSFNYER